ncbi:FAD binding domain-containing protein [Hydrogenophaga sp. BPS33]|uniref:FAD binding domain-containing protein n=1 Tax=Hydrogenophaga sp. BPS33 TaxID=2651974 RepID=UPI00131FA268|nr:FAD binding domain-containing protein [Hydrogenophaga sp. BPS33]QHE84961.1 xanthine dehydrogenase family protein subunit M [Hydrogenophaga sp. BPS33]
MKPSKFTYYEPTSVEQALVMLADVMDQDGRVIAGGQTLVPAMALRFAQPAYLIDINGIEPLKSLALKDGALEIGACVRHAAFHAPVCEGVLGALLSEVVRHIAHLPIRNRGTFCGSLANADPASEWCLVATTLNARLQARSVNAAREIEAAHFFLGYMTTALAADELLVSARLPLLPATTRFGFEEVSRRAGDFAQAVALAVVERDGEAWRHVRLGVGAVESTPRRIAAAEALLEGRVPTPDLLEEAARAAAADVAPLDTTEEGMRYRRHVTQTVVRRALLKALAQPELSPSTGRA